MTTMLATVDGDSRLVDLWVRSHRSPHTQRAYRREASRFLAFAGVPLRQVTLDAVQGYADRLAGAATTKALALAAVKSLLAFGHLTGYLSFDVGRVVKIAGGRDTLAERILPEEAVQRLLALETDRRNHALLRLLYCTGARVAEICRLRWVDVQPREEGGQVTLYGKGDKTRAVLLPRAVFAEVLTLRDGDSRDAPVFAITPSQVWRIVRAAALRAGVEGRVSPHWLRHAHASHALDRGAPIHLVQATLGHASVATTGRYLHARPTDSSSRYLAV